MRGKSGVLLGGLMWGALACGDTSGRCGPAEGTVERVIDGDTVMLPDELTMRYLLIDAPELGASPECFAQEAQSQNRALVLGATVGLEYDERCEDDFGRLLAYAFLGERLVNEVLLERGYGRLLLIPPNERYQDRLRAAERSARERRAGLWGECR